MIKKNSILELTRIVIICILTLTITACQDLSVQKANDGPIVNPSATIKVALLVPSGSSDDNQEDLAQNLIRAARMAINDHPKAKIEMLIFGTAGDPLRAEAAAKKAISQNVKLIIGPLFAESAKSVGKIAAASNINVLSFSNTSSIAGNNVFILGNSFQNTADRLLGFASQKGYNKISVVSPDTTAGSIAANAVRLSAKSNDLNLVGSYNYPFSADGIANNARKITRKIRRSGSDTVVLTADSASGLPLLAEFLLAKGLPIKDIKVLGLSRWDIPQTTLNTPGLRNGWFTVPDGAAINSFNKRYKKVYGNPPHPLAGFAYDGMKILATLLSEGNINAAQRSQITRPQGFKGASGAFRLLNNGSAQRALSVAEASAGALRIISPAPTRFGGSGAFLYEITK